MVIYRRFHYLDYVASNDWVRKEVFVAYLKFYPGIFLDELKKITKYLSKDRRCVCRDSNKDILNTSVERYSAKPPF